VEQKQFAQTLTSAGQIDGQTTKVGRGQRVSGQPGLVIRRKMVAQKSAGRRGVIGQHLLVWATDGDVDAAHSALLVDGRVLADEGVQGGLPQSKVPRSWFAVRDSTRVSSMALDKPPGGLQSRLVRSRRVVRRRQDRGFIPLCEADGASRFRRRRLGDRKACDRLNVR
jgi:hypothetical protein